MGCRTASEGICSAGCKHGSDSEMRQMAEYDSQVAAQTSDDCCQTRPQRNLRQWTLQTIAAESENWEDKNMFEHAGQSSTGAERLNLAPMFA